MLSVSHNIVVELPLRKNGLNSGNKKPAGTLNSSRLDDNDIES